MNLRNPLLGLAFFSAFVPLEALATPSTLWKNISDWHISVRDGSSATCVAKNFMPDGTTISLGFSEQTELPQLIVSNPNWTNQDAATNRDLIVQFGAQMPWRVPAMTSREALGAQNVELRIEAHTLNFFESVMGPGYFAVRFGDSDAVTYSIRQSFEALNELRACDNAFRPERPMQTAQSG